MSLRGRPAGSADPTASMADDLLTVDDPLFGWVKKAALTGERESCRWLALSARHWARGEFARRLRSENYEWLMGRENVEERLVASKLCQIAVQTKDDHVYVGMLAHETSMDFLRLQTMGGDWISGMYEVTDTFRLPPMWQLSPWPHDITRADSGMTVTMEPFHESGTVFRRACDDCWGTSDLTKSRCSRCQNKGYIEWRELENGNRVRLGN
jgi:hypothetical protein